MFLIRVLLLAFSSTTSIAVIACLVEAFRSHHVDAVSILVALCCFAAMGMSLAAGLEFYTPRDQPMRQRIYRLLDLSS